jgi:hypothetical protein
MDNSDIPASIRAAFAHDPVSLRRIADRLRKSRLRTALQQGEDEIRKQNDGYFIRPDTSPEDQDDSEE